jgi:GxxExxY protein
MANTTPAHWEITELVLQAFRTVFNKLGPNFLEAVYVRALEIECRKLGLRVRREVPIAVRYDGVIVGHYRADLLVNGVVVVEAKAGQRTGAHYAQLRAVSCRFLALSCRFISRRRNTVPADMFSQARYRRIDVLTFYRTECHI